MAITSSLLSKLRVKSSNCSMGQPISMGAANKLKILTWLYCSSGVKRVGCIIGPMETSPRIIMSGSIQWPGPENGAQRSRVKEVWYKLVQLSLMSGPVRYILVTRFQSLTLSKGALLEMLKTISRPDFFKASDIRSAETTSIRQSYLRKSVPQAAICRASLRSKRYLAIRL